MYLNKAIIIGNLTRDPELKALPSGMNVATFSLATNRVWKDKNGDKQEEVEYHNIVVFGKQADNVAKYMTKGSSLLVEGRIQTRSWEDENGTKKYRTEIVAESIQFGNKKATEGKNEPKKSGYDNISNEEEVEYPEDEINPGDIPF